ncbi:hypothetical protein RJ641_015426 [Dillenia turbinata]|uniref:Uncharacterized protein n=1 Tax=Dillenia turbinata TaxID=194707 RepID=A0AAN8UZ05_9MAGN
MGCCNSTQKHKIPSKRSYPPSHPYKPPIEEEQSIKNRAPPQVEEELESVKEVLSETPPSRPTFTNSNLIQNNKAHFTNDDKKPVTTTKSAMEEEKTAEDEEVTIEMSESFSLSETTMSATTTANTTMTDKRDDEVTSKVNSNAHRRGAVRSPGKRRPISGDRKQRNNVPSPQVRSWPPTRVSPNEVVREKKDLGNRRVPANGGVRIDSGDRSCRRSRSPATRVEGGARVVGSCRSESMRKTGRPGNRSRSPAPSTEMVDGFCEKSEKPPGVGPSGPESLENPLVSLECFIFL